MHRTRRDTFPTVEADLLRIGRSIHEALPARGRGPVKALDERAMGLAAGDEELRAALFRFVDVTPACRSLDDLARHLADYLEDVGERPPPIAAAMRMSGTKPGRAALGAAAAAGVRHMAHRFIVGETPAAAVRPIRRLWEDGAAVSLDLLGEATVTEAEADRYAARCREALDTLAEAAPRWPARPGTRGGLPRAGAAGEPVGEGLRAQSAAAARGARRRARGRRPEDAPPAPEGEGGGRPPAHRHGVGGHARGHHGAGVRPARGARAARRPLGGPRDAGLPARVAAAARARARVGRLHASGARRSWCGS